MDERQCRECTFWSWEWKDWRIIEASGFHQVENVIKQSVQTSAICSSRYEALGKFGEHSRS